MGLQDYSFYRVTTECAWLKLERASWPHLLFLQLAYRINRFNPIYYCGARLGGS